MSVELGFAVGRGEGDDAVCDARCGGAGGFAAQRMTHDWPTVQMLTFGRGGAIVGVEAEVGSVWCDVGVEDPDVRGEFLFAAAVGPDGPEGLLEWASFDGGGVEDGLGVGFDDDVLDLEVALGELAGEGWRRRREGLCSSKE